MQFLAIDSSRQDAFVSVSAFAQEREIPFPVLKDFDQQVADDFGAARTPEAFVLDAQRVIRYHGRIDDQYTVGVSRGKPTSRDLAAGARRAAGGQAGHHARAPKWRAVRSNASATAAAGSEVTYAKHVAASCKSAVRNATGRVKSARSRC